jgi:phosphoribosylaminoimidazolecarboxamide formyltransferase/IMP cyclohydrolase
MSGYPRRALVSVSDKSGLVPFVTRLVELKFEIVSTGGTKKHLQDSGIPVIDVAEYTGFPEIMDGRVKTLHPKVHGGLLGRPDLPEDAHAIQQHGIIPFELVVVNLYPFQQTIAKPGVTLAEAIENIDIGGPSMIRSAAKNHAYVGVITHHSQFDRVLSELDAGKLSLDFRRQLAGAAFEMTARYDRAIADYFDRINTPENKESTSKLPAEFSIRLHRQQTLRYGENPHQDAAFYVEKPAAAATLAATEQLHGKELSYNNLLDLDSALSMVREFPDPAAVVLKHNNPCGAASAADLAEAFRNAYAGDPVSAFGSILGFNREVDAATAEELCVPGRFVEAIVAPSFSADAFQILTTKPKWKANVRLLRCATLNDPRKPDLDFRRVTGGLLVQDRDEFPVGESDWRVMSKRQPTAAEWADLKFGWRICKHVKSNAIVFVKGGMVVGVGAGQMSRLDSCHMAAYKAGERSQGGCVASDAFFPFRDGIDESAKAGITAAVEPGGSVRDEEVIAACNEHNMALVFTGQRHFRH